MGAAATTALRDVLPRTCSSYSISTLEAIVHSQRSAQVDWPNCDSLLRNSAGGATFPFERVTAEEFKAAGLPSETGLYLELLSNLPSPQNCW